MAIGALPAGALIALRAVQAVFAIIVLGTAGYVASWWNSSWRHASPSEVSFLVFSSVWTLLAVAYLTIVPIRFSNTMAHHKFAILGVEAVTMIFWFAGFIALAVWLTGRVCYGTVCDAATAATVFAALEWLLFAASTTMGALHVFRTRGTTTTATAPTAKTETNLDMQGV